MLTFFEEGDGSMNKRESRFVWAVLWVSVAGLARADVRWVEPANGWDLVYAASNGVLPEVASPAWTKSGFTASTAALVTDEVTGEDALHLIMTSTSSKYANYTLSTGAGQFTTNDLTTCDFRFRLTDDSQPNDAMQLNLTLNGPRPDGLAGYQVFQLLFSKDRIRVADNGGASDYMMPLGTNWHSLRWLINWNTRQAKLYVDQIAAPWVEYQGSLKTTTPKNETMFGDGSGSVLGIARISYLRLTHNEWVEPDVLYVHDGNVNPAAEGWTYATTARTLDYAASNGVLPNAASPAWTAYYVAAGAAALVKDEVTGEDALHLIMTNSSGNYTFSNYAQTNPEGQFTTNDVATCRLRFRLMDGTQALDAPQLTWSISGPRTDGASGCQTFLVRFCRDRLLYGDNQSTTTSHLTDLGTNWQEIVWSQNFRTREASFYLVGNESSVISHRSYLTDNLYNQVLFGDGSGSVQGIARVSYLRVTRQGLTWSGGTLGATPYWQGVDYGTASGYYQGALPTQLVGHAEGWTATCKLRVVSASAADSAVSMLVQDGADQWSMMFTKGGLYYIGPSANAVHLGDFGRTDLFHTFQVYYNPAGNAGSGTVSYYDNGWLKGTITRANALDFATTSKVFQWGSLNAGATSTQQWSRVELTHGNQVIDPVPRDGTMISVK